MSRVPTLTAFLLGLILLVFTLGSCGGASALVVYERSGGRSGLDDRLTIYPDGRCELQRQDVKQEFTLQPSEVAQLKNVMADPNFLGLNVEYLPTDTGADLVKYVVTYRAEDDAIHTVRTMDGAVPDALWSVLGQLGQIISAKGTALVTYQRSGGVAGLSDELTIYFDGRYELQRKGVKQEFTLQPNELEHLKDLIAEADFTGLNVEYLPTDTGADLIEYVISYLTDEGIRHTVRTMDGAIPDALQPVIEELNWIILEKGRALVIYQRSGGIAGLRDQLTIYLDGRCELQRKGVEQEFTLQPDELEHLKDLTAEANFPSLNVEYLPTSTGADMFEYVVSYLTEDGTRYTVRTMDGAVPDALRPVIEELNRVILDRWISRR